MCGVGCRSSGTGGDTSCSGDQRLAVVRAIDPNAHPEALVEAAVVAGRGEDRSPRDGATSVGVLSRRFAAAASAHRSAWFSGGVQFTVTDAPERERFEAHAESGAVAGLVTYQLSANIIVYTHT